jgi:hypothetical protein
MSCFTEEITLENPLDVLKAQEGYIKESDVHRVTVNALVDTGAWTLVIGEDMEKQLGLKFLRKHVSEVSGGEKKEGYLAFPPVSIYWHDRISAVYPFVLPGEPEVILGALPMEIMDVWLNPRQECLVPKNTMRTVK